MKLATLLACLALAACSSSPPPVDEKAAVQSVEDQLEALNTRMQSKDNSTKEKYLAVLGEALEGFREIDTSDTPGEFQEQYGKMVDAMEDMRDFMRDTDAPTMEELQPVLAAFEQETTKLKALADALKE